MLNKISDSNSEILYHIFYIINNHFNDTTHQHMPPNQPTLL